MRFELGAISSLLVELLLLGAKRLRAFASSIEEGAREFQRAVHLRS